ncbi:MAG: hypothetical protein KGS09_14210 [Nitrospirae bacterium]|nr:hypothetical protein [Nitrospirota bacterium]MBU6481687.1 hypothetical protein [Nitrospirota bacterium]
MLNASVEDGPMAANPAAKLVRVLKLTLSKATEQEEINARTKARRQLFLATAFHKAPRNCPLFFVLAETGMRLGEALALNGGS